MKKNFQIGDVYMTLTKSEKARQAYKSWSKSNYTTLDDAYTTCSFEKHRAFANCVYRACAIGYTQMRIFNCCSMTFNFGYLTVNDDDGIVYFVWETKENIFCCPYEWLKANC